MSDAVIIGTGEAGYTRHPEPGQNTHTFLRDAVVSALRDANLKLSDVDGLAISSFSMEPDKSVDMAWRFGMSLRWLLQDTNGGAGGINMLGHAVRGIEAGAASVIVVVGGDAMPPEGFARLDCQLQPRDPRPCRAARPRRTEFAVRHADPAPDAGVRPGAPRLRPSGDLRNAPGPAAIPARSIASR